MPLVLSPDPLSQQIAKLMQLLEGLSPEDRAKDSIRKDIITWVRKLPSGTRPSELIRKVAASFELSEEQIEDMVEPARKKKQDFEALVPPSGWLTDYIEYTRMTESPTPYHFFAGAVAIATALARNVYYRRGDKDIYPNLCAVLVGPSGIVRKTTACNLAIRLVTAIGGNVLADKLTPEAFVEAFKERESATGMIFAPELAVFFGKQKYNEGLITMLTALLDCPDTWKSGTIMRGQSELRNVGITMLGASTVDWLQHAIPKDAFGGGFMSRIIFVVQERTPKCFPDPPPLSETMRKSLRDRLIGITQVRGPFTRSASAAKWWDKWYRMITARSVENKHHSGYLARVPDQVWKLSMVLAISEGQTTGHLEVTDLHFMRAAAIMNWIESYLPTTFEQLSESSLGAEQMGIVAQLKQAGGQLTHTALLRKNTRRMNGETFRRYTTTLRDAGLMEYDSKTKSYYLTPEGWK